MTRGASCIRTLNLPLDMAVTYTKQVTKKNKVFSDGFMTVSESLLAKVFDECRMCISTISLVGNKVKHEVFLNQYARAVADGEGFIQGVFDGVIVFIESPPHVERFKTSLSPLEKRQRSAPANCDARLSVEEFTPMEKERTGSDFQPATCINAMENLKRKCQFQPISNPDQLMSLYMDIPVRTFVPSSTALTLYSVRLLNMLNKEAFDTLFSSVKHSNEKYVVAFPPDKKWRLDVKGEKVYISLPTATGPPRDFFDILAVTPQGPESPECLFALNWKAFDMRGMMEVFAFSKEAQELILKNANRTLLLRQVRGIVGLHCSVSLIKPVRSLAAADGPDCLFKHIVSSTSLTQPRLRMELGKDCDASTFLTGLSEEQGSIVRSVVGWFTSSDTSVPCYTVHGVFGSGKTRVLAACIKVIVKLMANDERILLTAATNVAVDNVLTRLRDNIPSGCIARMGVKERIDKDLHSLVCKGSKAQSERKKIIAATATCALSEIDFDCDFLVVDEAAQLTEVSAVPVILRTRPKRILMFGDMNQLRQPGTESISPSLIEAFENFNSPLVTKLCLWTQYRCANRIAQVCSDLFYKSRVLMGEQFNEPEAPIPTLGIVVHNYESARGSLASQKNLGEFELILKFLRKYQEYISQKRVAIISFYNSQVALIQEELSLFASNIRADTVDSFQGGEADIVILSTVASNVSRSEMFVANPNRLNVAISRAKRHLIVFGHSQLWERQNTYKRIVEYGQRLEL